MRGKRRKPLNLKLNVHTSHVFVSCVSNSASLFCRLCFEEMSQWSSSLDRLLASKCKLIINAATKPSLMLINTG